MIQNVSSNGPQAVSTQIFFACNPKDWWKKMDFTETINVKMLEINVWKPNKTRSLELLVI